MAAPHSPPPTAATPLDQAKRAARAAARTTRQGQDPLAAGLALGAWVMRLCPPPPGAVVAGFWPMADEIDLRPLLFGLHLRGHTIALPVTPPIGQGLSFRSWQPGAPMIRERFGTLAPTGAPVTPDYLLVPLLAFDGACRRLGYGAGYYDRTLATLRGARTIGCAFAAQRVDRVPVGPHDITLDAVATEHGVIFSKEA